MQNTENALDNYIDMIDNYSDFLVMKNKFCVKIAIISAFFDLPLLHKISHNFDVFWLLETCKVFLESL